MKTITLTKDNTVWLLGETILRRDDITCAADLDLPPKIKADTLVKFVKRYDYEPGDKLEVEWVLGETLQDIYQLGIVYLFLNLFDQPYNCYLDSQRLRVENFYERRVGVGYCFLALDDSHEIELYLYERAKNLEQLTPDQQDDFYKEVEEFRKLAQRNKRWSGLQGLVDSVFEWERLEQERLTSKLNNYKEPCKNCQTNLRLKIGKLGGYYSCPNCRREQLASLEVYTKCKNCGEEQVERILPNGEVFLSCKTYPKCREIEA